MPGTHDRRAIRRWGLFLLFQKRFNEVLWQWMGIIPAAAQNIFTNVGTGEKKYRQSFVTRIVKNYAPSMWSMRGQIFLRLMITSSHTHFCYLICIVSWAISMTADGVHI